MIQLLISTFLLDFLLYIYIIYKHDTSTLTHTDTNQKRMAVFYNTYQNPNDTSIARDIIYYQLKTINKSPLANSTVYYSRLGDLTQFPMIKCLNEGRRTCIELVAKEKGDEIETIQPLYEYCVQNHNDRVVYMHSKGSFTRSKSNRILMKILMKAITSEDCLLEMGRTNGYDCNTCSTQFNGFPVHYPGNMCKFFFFDSTTKLVFHGI